MLFASKLSDDQWAEARRLRADGASFASLAARFGMAARSISSRAAREGWHKVASADVAADGAASLESPRPMPRRPLQVHRALARRLFRILDIELTLVEMRMQKRLDDARTDPELLAESSETDVRRAKAALQVAAEITESEADIDTRFAARKSASAGAAAETSEADVFRREVAERLAKLVPPS